MVGDREDLATIWLQVRRLVARATVTVVASVNEDGSPHLTPIGSLYLRRDELTGFYLERFPTTLPRNLERDQRFAVYAGRSDAAIWLKSMLRGRFDELIAIRLLGRAGKKRPVQEDERARFLKRMRLFRFTKGYRLLWGDFRFARELTFDGFELVQAGEMTRRLVTRIEAARTASA